MLVDHECAHLVKGRTIPVIITYDTGRVGDPYEEFLASGRRFSRERGWPGLEAEVNENAPAVLCYTSVSPYMTFCAQTYIHACSSGTTGRVCSMI